MKEPQQNQNKVRTGPETGRQTKVRPKCVKRETIKIETKMKKQMKRTVYEAPVTELFRVELEGNFCGSADVENTKNPTTGLIDEQSVNANFDATFGGTYTDADGNTTSNWE